MKTAKKLTLTLTASVLALSASLGSTAASADHGGDRYDQNVIRVHLPIHDNGPETLKLRRMIQQQRRLGNRGHLDLNRYRLQAVVIKNGPFSNGYANLRVGERRTGRVFLPGRERILINAPGRDNNDWRLRLGPGTQVRMVTAVLYPRKQRHDWYGRHDQQRHNDYSFQSRGISTAGDPLQSLTWLITQGQDNKRDKNQARRLKKTRAELARTEAELAATRARLGQSRKHNKQLKDRKDRLANEIAHHRATDQTKGKTRQADRGTDNQQRDHKRSHEKQRQAARVDNRTDVRRVTSNYPRLRSHG